MAQAAASPSPGFWRRGAHEVSLARLYLLRAVALFVVVDGFWSKLPDVIYPDLVSPSRGILPSFLAALWVSAFLAFRYPLRMMPLFLFELIWKTLWLIDYGAPQWLAGPASPRLARDLFEIGFFPLPIALILPWGFIWRRYIRAPAERWHGPTGDASAFPDPAETGAGQISQTRFNLVRGAFLLSAIAGCILVLPGIVQPDPAVRGMLQSTIAGLWVTGLIGLLHPVRMVPMLLFAFAWTMFWLADYGLTGALSGNAGPQFQSDLLAIGGAAILVTLAMPWGHVWRCYFRAPGDRWR